MDSCDFIEAIEHSEGVPTDPTRANDTWYIRKCLEASRAGEIKAITSMLTIAEVRRAGDVPLERVTDRVKRVIRSVLTSGRIVTLAEMTQGIAEKARDLHWEHGINPGGADAIHVATAIVTGCKEFSTSDARKKSPHAYKAEIAALGVRVIRAADTRLLPKEYLQGSILPANPASE